MSVQPNRNASPRSQRTTFALDGLGFDGGRVPAVEQALLAVPGVTRVHVNAATEMAYVAYTPAGCTQADLVAAVEQAGCQVSEMQTFATTPPVTEARPGVSPGSPDPREAGTMDADHACCDLAIATTPASRQTKAASGLPFRWRRAAFAGIVLVVLGAGLWLALAARMPDAQAMYQVNMSMSGFQPARFVVPANQAVTVQLNNVDSPFHAITNGALHQFAIAALGIDVKLDGRQSRTITLPALAPGTYEYYCDVCCGGKVNPAMHGTLVVQ